MPSHLETVPEIMAKLTWDPAFLDKPSRGSTWGVGTKAWGMKCGNKQPGVYFIRENGVLVYLGISKYDLKMRCYRKFSKPDVWQGKPRLNYEQLKEVHVYEVAHIVVRSQDMRVEMEAMLIRELKPRDNKQVAPGEMLERLPIDPNWVVDERPAPF